MALSTDDVRWVAQLARLRLADAELAAMTRDLSAIVAYVEQLQTIDTTGVAPLAHALDLHDIFRSDDPAPSLPVDAALANAPVRKGDFFRVPAVLE